MREILFRGKRLEIGQFATEKVGEWVYGGYAKDCSGEYIYSTMQSHRMIKVDPDTVGQYTGLTDKNGVKIFEGDILLIGDSKKPVLVEFINFTWECTSKSIGPYYRHRLEDNSQKYEIIGNIHDNQDLLNDT